MHTQNKKIKKNVESLEIQRYHLILQWEVKFESLFPLKKRKKKKIRIRISPNGLTWAFKQQYGFYLFFNIWLYIPWHPVLLNLNCPGSYAQSKTFTFDGLAQKF